ncbi:hydroxyacid dehydrogenase [filamentous cyanobacterium CCP5]|nr:hydroxyacid dehydrogenase [filamentous cyanobacterium CCP5]
MNTGVIGTGLMGAPMALRLLTSGHKVWAYNRTTEKLHSLKLAGANICASPAAVAMEAEVLVLMLTDAAAIRSVLGPEVPLKGKTLIQMGTIAPADSRALEQEFADQGANYLEAPVLGSIPEAKSGKLIVMAGAPPELFATWKSLLACFGPDPLHVGPVGSAATLKLAMNQLIGTLTSAFAQSLSLIQKEGISVDDFMQVLRSSALFAPTFDKKLKRMIKRDFSDPNFPAKHLLKDMGLFVDAAAALGINPKVASSVQALVQQTVANGHGDEDYSSLFDVVQPPPEA